MLAAAGVLAAWAGATLAAEGGKGMPRRLDPQYSQALAGVRFCSPIALRRAIEDLTATYGAQYPRGQEFLNRLDKFEDGLLAQLGKSDLAPMTQAKEYQDLCREALLANPLMKFEKLLVVRRAGGLAMPANWQGNCSLNQAGYDNEIAVLSPVAPSGKLTTLFKPQGGAFVGDVDLNFDADTMLFSMPDNGRWQVFEIRADGAGLRQVTKGEEPDVHNYDPCYLPSGKVMYCSTAVFHGVPCVGGADAVANLFTCDADGGHARQLGFDQDHNWCPTVLNDGRVLYTRWEYSDLPHYFSRHLFHMNPDGTNQTEYYHSNSYWPNSTFYARPIPGHPTKVVAVISGHHGVARIGELVIFDPALGRQEEQGAVQRIPGHGKKVESIVADGLVEGSWPKYLHPFPLSEKYFLVAAQPSPSSAWGVYLVDVFDNMTLIAESPGSALLEPIPFRPTVRPPVIPDRVNLEKTDATVYLSDIYQGPGLKDVPRGTIKKLRLYGPHFAYNGMGGHISIGIDGPWDVHRILGTVPVAADGSAAFTVPANTPISVQPLDGEGRSWFTAMPGEVVACTGCHVMQNGAPSPGRKQAALAPPAAIASWYGPARGLSFKRDVQPVLDKYCVGCHNEKTGAASANFVGGVPDFSAKGRDGWGHFTPAYAALQSFVRRPGPESDAHIQVPMEWGADTSELIRTLKKGHHNVQLDAQAWDRLYTWIDLNVPDHGTWTEQANARPAMKRRLEMRTKYANNAEDPEAILVRYDTPNA
ncbi:MAG: formylglycine-generating enzyme family protein, partial [Planctomycetota bacterium]|nr:formylglycine-generating enzyme family protein [Planctomycetota bacterium]